MQPVELPLICKLDAARGPGCGRMKLYYLAVWLTDYDAGQGIGFGCKARSMNVVSSRADITA